MENLTDAGNATGETLLETFFWAVQRGDVKRLEELGAPLGGQSQPGDTAGELTKSEKAAMQIMQSIITNSAGFRLTSKPLPKDNVIEVRFDAVSRPESKGNESIKNAFFTFYLAPKPDGWGFTTPEDSEGK